MLSQLMTTLEKTKFYLFLKLMVSAQHCSTDQFRLRFSMALWRHNELLQRQGRTYCSGVQLIGGALPQSLWDNKGGCCETKLTYKQSYDCIICVIWLSPLEFSREAPDFPLNIQDFFWGRNLANSRGKSGTITWDVICKSLVSDIKCFITIVLLYSAFWCLYNRIGHLVGIKAYHCFCYTGN